MRRDGLFSVFQSERGDLPGPELQLHAAILDRKRADFPAVDSHKRRGLYAFGQQNRAGLFKFGIIGQPQLGGLRVNPACGGLHEMRVFHRQKAR